MFTNSEANAIQTYAHQTNSLNEIHLTNSDTWPKNSSLRGQANNL